MAQSGIELTIYVGRFGEQTKTLRLPIDDRLMRELMEPMELSDEPLSLFLASPGMFGGKGDAVTLRQQKFEMRRDTAKYIAGLVERELVKQFGVNDQVNGYRQDEWSERDQRQADYVRRDR